MGPFGSLEILLIINLKKLMAKDHNLITKVFSEPHTFAAGTQ
jgi:hypothetical protein